MAISKPIPNRLILSAILLIVLAFAFYTPYPLINSDSVHGFEAMNGWFCTGKFNTVLIYNETTHQIAEKFLTWWSPGQYLVPQFFMNVFDMKLGPTLVLINIFSVFFGTAGFYFVFKKYGFEARTIWFSTALILLSGSVLTGYWEYDGGENLNFIFFPWIIICQHLLVKKLWKYILPGVILFIAFICKLQMLIVVPPLLVLLIYTQDQQLNFNLLQGHPFRLAALPVIIRKYFPLIVSVLPVAWLIYAGFISSGDTPAHSVKGFSLNAENLFFPIASPVTSIYIFDAIHYYLLKTTSLYYIYLAIISTIVLACMFYVGRRFGTYNDAKKKYIFVVFGLYMYCVIVFIILYTKGTPIDMNPRHLKLTSFLLYPVLTELALKKINIRLVAAAFFALTILAIANHVRLNHKWTDKTEVSQSGVRMFKTDMPLMMKTRLDSAVKEKTIVISQYEGRYSVDNKLIMAITLYNRQQEKITYGPYPIIFADTLR